MLKDFGGRLSRRGFLAGTGAVAAGMTFGPKFSFGAEEPKLNLYNWDTYIGEDTLPQFKDASGIEVKMDLYADNDELFAKLKEGNPGYDVIIPTNDYVERMITANMLEQIDRAMITNFGNLNPNFQDAAYDPGRKHSMPYMWGTQGIGYRKSKVSSVPDSWKTMLDSDEYSGRIALLSEGVLPVALKYLGYSYNDTDPAHLAEAEALLIKQKPHIKTFAHDNGQDLLLAGEVDLTMEWNGDILQVMAEDDDIGYTVPKEGGLRVGGLLVHTQGGLRIRMNAHKFINYVLDAKAGAAIADYIQYATPNDKAREGICCRTSTPRIRLSCSARCGVTRQRCESAIYQGQEDHQRVIVTRAWTRIQAA